MPRLSSLLMVAAALLVVTIGCNDDRDATPTSIENVRSHNEAAPRASTGEALPVADPTVIAEIANAASGEAVKVYNGGYGSAMAFDPRDHNTFYLLTDRGPNFDFNGGIAFPIPDFAPQIGVFRRQAGTLVHTGVITLKRANWEPLTGLPIPAGAGGSTGETAYAVDGTVLNPDPEGLDPEGLVALPNGSFWVSDEYGPFLVHFDHHGSTIERIGPSGGSRALPAVLARRRPNRGMEGLTAIHGGLVLVGIMQSPLDNPKAAGRASRLARIVAFDTRTGDTRQYVYLLEAANLTNSEILALSSWRFLVLERDGDFPGDNPAAVKRLYEIDLRGATDISDPADGARGLLVNGQSLEELTAGAADPDAVLRAAGVKPVQKTLALDILAAFPDYRHDKVEGLALVGPSTVAISNDDDFGVTNGTGGLVAKLLGGVTPPTVDFNEVLFARIPDLPGRND